MQIRELVLHNFRNHKKRSISFSENVTAIIGANATGKSNILEAIYLLSIGKSIKADKDEELIRFGEETAHLEAHLSGGDIEKLEVTVYNNPLGRLQKVFIVNGVKRRRLDFVGILRSVLFTPEDIELIIDSPSIRREYINTVLSQVDKEYRQRLSRYEHALKRRNKILFFIREQRARATDLAIWDHIVVESGQKLVENRKRFFHELNEKNKQFPTINWKYLPREISQERLDECRARDIDAALTLSGPHRDDFEFYDGERNLERFGSRGEQRIGVLALKMAELNFIQDRTQERPILLLDDIFSELDEAHRHTVLSLLGQQQTIITSTEEEYMIDAGNIKPTIIHLP